jgi:predicted  nucleic acid-binding Zn-ribbon protein
MVLEHLEKLSRVLDQERPSSERRAQQLERRREEVKAALAKYYSVFETSADPARDEALLDRVKELRKELQDVESEIAELKAKVVPIRPKLSKEKVERYLEALRSKLDTRPQFQKTLFQELKRDHGLKVRALSKENYVLSLAVPGRELVTEERHVLTVVAGRSARGGSEVPGSPEPGGPHMSTLCPPAAASSRASFTSG